MRLAGNRALREFLFEVVQRILQPFLKADFRFPTEQTLRLRDVRTALLWIVLRQRFMNDGERVREVGTNALGKFVNAQFGGVSYVCGEMFIGLAELVNSFDEIRNI